MRLIPHLSDTIKGILLIISGSIILVQVVGIGSELLYNIVLFGSIAMIIIGILMANIHKHVMRLIRKNESPQQPKEPHESDDEPKGPTGW